MNKNLERAGVVLTSPRIVGGFVLAIVFVTLVVDVLGLVHQCPYCRTERAALGVLSIILLCGWHHMLGARYAALVCGLFSLVVGIMQNFNHIRKINAGTFDWAGLRFDHPWVLSGLAIMATTWMMMLILGLAQAPRLARS